MCNEISSNFMVNKYPQIFSNLWLKITINKENIYLCQQFFKQNRSKSCSWNYGYIKTIMVTIVLTSCCIHWYVLRNCTVNYYLEEKKNAGYLKTTSINIFLRSFHYMGKLKQTWRKINATLEYTDQIMPLRKLSSYPLPNSITM